MIDLSHPISQQDIYTTDNTQLLVTYDVAQVKRDYVFDNIIFAYVEKGQKNINIPGLKHFTLMPEMVIMGASPIEAEVDILMDSKNNPAHCFCLEVSKEKVFGILDKIYESEDFEHISEPSEGLNPFNVYVGAGANMVMDNLLSMQKLIESDVRFKDRWVDLKIEELMLCCLQTNMYETLIHSYGNHKMLDNPLSEVIRYIKANYHTKIDVNKLAEKACMSQATFYRHFKRSLGTTPIDYIHGERIAKAKTLLKNRHTSIGNISFQLGYNSPSYFALQFEKHLGCSPREYQKKAY
ncbi:helix-turn-helix domain-containing protein [Marivirga sp.]|uniref:helix-turn-helix domain-containing protein n=1 Tax=Marivirga sp. TaxID=2018662 RepID=UPI0025E29EA9|nr:AraC family transcriptional regulator [Marivirga sp.]